jgi:hypothetical protein
LAHWEGGPAGPQGTKIVQWAFSNALKLNDEGQVTLPVAREPETASSLIASRISFHDDVTLRAARLLTRSALIDSYKSDPDRPEGFLGVLSGLESEFLRKPLASFVLLTSLSASDLADFPTVRLNGSTITFSSHPPGRFGTPDRVLRHRWNASRFQNRTAVRVSVRARDPFDAADAALRQLDLLRSFWNLGLHRGQWRISLGGPIPPINKLRLGPLHTLHNSDGSPALGTFWYEPEFEESETTERLGKEKKKRLKEQEQWCRERLTGLVDRERVEQLWIRYCQALDQRDQNNAFLRSWSILEDLTGNPRNYDQLLKRASYLYFDRWYVRLQLEELRQMRNELVHSGQVTDDVERHVFMLKGMIEHYLLFMLQNPRVVGTLTGLAAFLSQPANPDLIDAQTTRLSLARGILEEPRRRS